MIGAKNSSESDTWQENQSANEGFMTDFGPMFDDDLEINNKKKKKKKKKKNTSTHHHSGIDYYDEDYGGLGDFHGKKEKRKVPIVKNTNVKKAKVHIDNRNAPSGQHAATSHNHQQLLHLPEPKALR